MEQQKELEKVIVGMRRRLMDEARRFLRNQDEAEDTVQDVVLKLWTMRDRLGDYRSVEATPPVPEAQARLRQVSRPAGPKGNNRQRVAGATAHRQGDGRTAAGAHRLAA